MDNRPVYVRVVDRPKLIELIKTQATYYPRVIEVQPNGEGALPLLQFLHDFGEELVPLMWVKQPRQLQQTARPTVLDRLRGYRWESTHPEYRHLLCATRDVLINLRTYNAGALEHAAESLESAALIHQAQSSDRCYPRTAAIAAFLRSLATNLILPLEQGQVHTHDSPNLQNKAWWGTLSPLFNICTEMMHELDKISKPAPGPVCLAELRTWIFKLRTQIELMHMSVGRKHAEVFVQASAWFTSCSIRQMEQAHTSLGLLFLHRAVDCLLMAKATDQGLLDFSRPGGVYKLQYQSQVSNKPPSLALNLDLLGGKINFHQLESAFRELNEWRNLLPYTHHMSTPRDQAASNLCHRIHMKLTQFAGSTAWSTAVDTYCSEPPLTVGGLLDPDGVLQSCMTPH